MSNRWLQFFKSAFELEPALHPLDHRMAKKYVKERLVVVYSELRNDPLALERAYQALNLEPRLGIGKDEAPTVFELSLPESVN
ncbi:MAG: hypothetical protein ABIT76_04545 [Chthoniobacterales bacterium]